MKGKVNCTCGWSWNKSDSSAKDMYICHKCGKDNNMKNSGWLDSYEDGGSMQEYQENYNDSSVSLPEGFVGMGYDTKGRNYSPAWGGQFQMGGNVYPVNYVPQAQDGKKLNPFTYPKPDYNYNTNPFLVRDPQHGIFIGGINPTYSTKDFSIGASTVGVGNKDFIKPIVDYGIRGSYNPTDSLSINANLSKNNVGAGVSYRFQEGGSLPGASGMMYARQGAPSNGKYAKKTMPSAQDGKKQFKLKDERLQGVTTRDNIPTPIFNKKQERPLTPEEIKQREKILREQRIAERQGEIRQYTPQSKLSKAKEVALNPLTAFGYVARNEELPDNFSKGDRVVTDYVADFANPAYYVESAKNLAENQAQVFSDLYQGNFGDAALSQTMAGVEALSLIPIGKPLTKAAKLALNNTALTTLPKAKNIREVVGTFAGIPTERSLPRLSPEELKIYRQVQEIGRMRSTGKPISEQYRYAIEQGVPEEHLQQIFKKSKSEIESAIPNALQTESFRSANPIRDRLNLQRPPRRTSTSDQMIDVMNSSPEEISNFSARIGMTEDELINFARSTIPTQSRSDVIRHTLSDYDIDGITNQLNPIPEELILNTGSRSRVLIPGQQRQRMSLSDSFSQKNAETQRNIYNNLQSTKNKIAASSQNYPYYKGPVLENVPSLSLSSSGSLKGVSNKVTSQSSSGINSGDVFTGSLNTSHSSYLPQLKQVFKYGEGSPQFLGYKPMNQMGFLSDFNYSADDVAKYLNTEIDEQIKRGIIPKNVSRPYSTNKPNANYQSVNLPHYGIKQFQQGGIIKDDRGQWEHPGEITEINSPYITMKNVPYPVLGISDTGDTQMMYPEEEYEFDGNKVTEYPLAKNGKELVKLNQLTNFTNYNTKQPGGWLDQY